MTTELHFSAQILERTFIRCFRPIHILQTILFCMPVKIQDGFVYRLCLLEQLMCLPWVLLTTASYFFKIEAYPTIEPVLYNALSGLVYIVLVSHCLITNNSNGKVRKLYLELQAIDRKLTLEKCPQINRSVFTYNVVLLTLVLFTYLLTCIYETYDVSLVETVFGFIQASGELTMDLTLCHFSSFVYYLNLRVRCLNACLKQFLTDDGLSENVAKYRLLLSDGHLAQIVNPDIPKDVMWETTKMIINAHKRMKKVFRFHLLVIISASLLWSLMRISHIIHLAGEKRYEVILGPATSLARSFVRVILASWSCQRFHAAIEALGETCDRILCESDDESGCWIAEAIRWVVADAGAAARWTVYGMFSLEAVTAVHVAAVIVAYAVVIMQIELT